VLLSRTVVGTVSYDDSSYNVKLIVTATSLGYYRRCICETFLALAALGNPLMEIGRSATRSSRCELSARRSFEVVGASQPPIEASQGRSQSLTLLYSAAVWLLVWVIPWS
jgi:hypothetical protein